MYIHYTIYIGFMQVHILASYTFLLDIWMLTPASWDMLYDMK